VGAAPPTALSSPADIGEFDLETPAVNALRPAPLGSATFTQYQVNGDYLGFGNNVTAWNLQLAGPDSTSPPGPSPMIKRASP